MSTVELDGEFVVSQDCYGEFTATYPTDVIGEFRNTEYCNAVFSDYRSVTGRTL